MLENFIKYSWLAGSLAIGALLLVAQVLTSCAAHAETRTVDGSNKTIYFDTAGKKLKPLEANRKGEAGEPVLACKLQDYECNERTGKCSLKNAR